MQQYLQDQLTQLKAFCSHPGKRNTDCQELAALQLALMKAGTANCSGDLTAVVHFFRVMD